MVNKAAQADRLVAEMRHTPSAEEVAGRAASVVGRYRLQPDDLPAGRHTGQIHSINAQGVEALTPLVYISGLNKPLALSEADVQTLVRMSDSPFSGDWIGRTVEVRTVRIDNARMLRLYAPGAAGLPVDTPPPPAHAGKRQALLSALFVVVVAVAALLLVFAEQVASWWTLLEQAIASFSGS